jgi:cell division inhibitor SepF
MSALRKAGVWLGLVEEEDDRHDDGLFDDEFTDDDDYAVPARPRSLSRPSSRATEHDRVSDRERDRERERRDRERELRIADHRGITDQRSGSDRSGSDRSGSDQRSGERQLRTEPEARSDRLSEPRASVRQLGRPAATTPPVTYPTQDNLALAPQVQLRERAVVNDEKSRRYQITTLHPTSYSEARAIGEHFREGYPVIMNLTEMDEPDAKRLVDFAAGLAFGMRGSMERVTNRVFLLSPPNIQVSAEDKARIAEGGFFDQG